MRIAMPLLCINMFFFILCWRADTQPLPANSPSSQQSFQPTELPKFIFGYSTGHVGTTTFASELSYNSDIRKISDIEFQHEAHRLHYWDWKKMDLEGEFDWVKSDYWPWVLNRLKNTKKTSIFRRRSS